MLPHATFIGIAITAATLAVLIAQFFRARRVHAFPVYGWLGILALIAGEWLMFHGVEPLATYFTPFAWSAWILLADASVLALTGRSRLRDSPLALARMALLSIPLWLFFEAYNLRLHNWTYVGVPRQWAAALVGYGWSFATITPAIFETADLAQVLFPARARQPLKISLRAEAVIAAIGAACLIIPLVIRQPIAAHLFVLVWIGFVLLLDPLNHRLGLPSFLGDLAAGSTQRLRGFLISGWTCGWLWEFWNNWAAAKWHYTFPMFQQWKIFEMPAPGYLGFLPFALDCFAMYTTVAYLVGWLKQSI